MNVSNSGMLILVCNELRKSTFNSTQCYLWCAAHPFFTQSDDQITIQLFRDCMRLVKHIAPGSSPKGVALKAMVRAEFKKSIHEKDEAKIEALKAGAIRALSNYMLYESGAKDEKLQGAMKRQSDDALGDLQSLKSPRSTNKAIGATEAEDNDNKR